MLPFICLCSGPNLLVPGQAYIRTWKPNIRSDPLSDYDTVNVNNLHKVTLEKVSSGEEINNHRFAWSVLRSFDWLYLGNIGRFFSIHKAVNHDRRLQETETSNQRSFPWDRYKGACIKNETKNKKTLVCARMWPKSTWTK